MPKILSFSHTILAAQTAIIFFLSIILYDQNKTISALQTSLILYFSLEASTPERLYNPPPLIQRNEKAKILRLKELI